MDMAAITRASQTETHLNLRVPQILTTIILVLVAVAAAGGLFIPGLYRDTPWAVGQIRAQDWVTLLGTVPALAAATFATRKGSLRAALLMLGLLSYTLYTYIGGAFAFAFNEFYPIYVALFSLCAVAMVAVVSNIDPNAIRQRFDAAAPRWPVALFLTSMALIIAVVEAGHILPFYTKGVLPEAVAASGNATSFIYSLDLGVVFPLSLLSAIWLWRRHPWSYVLSTCMLIWHATFGIVLVLTIPYCAAMGYPSPGIEGIGGYVYMAAGGLGLTVWLLRHCRG